VDCSDAVFILRFLFLGTQPPPDPGPASLPCGDDPAGSESLGCERYEPCD
jgi:hypothetical protein